MAVDTVTFEDPGDGRIRPVNTSLFFTTDERDSALHSPMEQGPIECYVALDRLLQTLG